VAAAGARAAVPVQPGREGGAVRARGGAAAAAAAGQAEAPRIWELPHGEQPPLTLFFLASHAAAAYAGDAASLLPISPCG